MYARPSFDLSTQLRTTPAQSSQPYCTINEDPAGLTRAATTPARAHSVRALATIMRNPAVRLQDLVSVPHQSRHWFRYLLYGALKNGHYSLLWSGRQVTR